MVKILATRVTGTIALPKQSGKLAASACANITVVATSKDLLSHDPNEFGEPKWAATGKAKMIWGQCRYSINVPPKSAFYLTAGGHGRGFACTLIDSFSTPTGAALGPVSVPLGGKHTVNLVVKKVNACNMLALLLLAWVVRTKPNSKASVE